MKNKNRGLCILLAISIALPTLPFGLANAYADTSGEVQSVNPFVLPVTQQTVVPDGWIGIYTADQFIAIGEDADSLGKNYILMSDITLNTLGTIQPIGSSAKPFIGQLDGNGYTISKLMIGATTESTIGLFGCVADKGRIFDLNIGQSDFRIMNSMQTTICAGAIAGIVRSGAEIRNCVDSGPMSIINDSTAGGIVATVGEGGLVSYCRNTGKIQSCPMTGGIAVRVSAGGIVTNSMNTGLVMGYSSSEPYGYVGGVAAILESGGEITQSYNSGTVNLADVGSGTLTYAGGIAGENGGTITNCYNTAAVQGSSYADTVLGGITGNTISGSQIMSSYNTGIADAYDATSPTGPITGEIESASVTACYYLDTMSGNGIGIALGKYQFQDTTNFTGFDFESIWVIDGDITYAAPYLRSTGRPIQTQDVIHFAGGDGTAFNPYLVSTKAQLNSVRDYPTKYFRLVNDITFASGDFTLGGAYYNSGKGWSPIGIVNNTFRGEFEGNGHAIIGLQENTTDYRGGLFGLVSTKGTIRNLALQDANIQTSGYAGGIAGGVSDGAILSNCSVTGSIFGKTGAGGIIGSSSSGSIVQDCINQAAVSSAESQNPTAGGIAGATSGRLLRCVNQGDVRSASVPSDDGTQLNPKAGGIAGLIQSGGEAVLCSNHGTVIAQTTPPYPLTDAYRKEANAGGIAGFSEGSVLTCNNQASVTAQASDVKGIAYAGGAVGKMDVSACIEKTCNIGSVSTIGWSAASGGLAGYSATAEASISDSFNTGFVSADSSEVAYAGGVAGYFSASSMLRCYSVSKLSAVAPIPMMGGSGATNYNNAIIEGCYWMTGIPDNQAGQELSLEMFAQKENFINYDFSGIWTMNAEIGRPVLTSQPIETSLLKLITNGGLLKQTAPVAYMGGSYNILPKPTKVGYGFGGWYTSATYQGNAVTYVGAGESGDKTFFAKWSPNTYTIKFNANGGTSGTMTSLSMTYDASKNLTANAFKRTGYSFLGWAKTSTGTVAYKDKASVKNLTAANKATVNLYAKWGAPITAAASYNYNSIKVSWASAGGATSYKIYRATSATGKYYLVHTSASTTRAWIDYGKITGKTYYYKVYPVAGGKTYSFGTYKSAKAIPSTPKVSVAKYTTTSAKVSWTGVSGATKYQIYRATMPKGSTTYGPYSRVCTASSTVRSWIDSGKTAGASYKYVVRAYHLEGTTYVYGNCSTTQYLKF